MIFQTALGKQLPSYLLRIAANKFPREVLVLYADRLFSYQAFLDPHANNHEQSASSPRRTIKKGLPVRRTAIMRHAPAQRDNLSTKTIPSGTLLPGSSQLGAPNSRSRVGVQLQENTITCTSRNWLICVQGASAKRAGVAGRKVTRFLRAPRVARQCDK